MKLFLPQPIAQYVFEHTRARPAIFDELRDYTLANVEMPQMQVGRVEGALLKMLAALVGARRVLEIGCYTGYSALCLAEALPDDGEVITCDRSEAFTAVAKRFWDKSPHGHKITLKLGDALDTVNALAGPFDMVFMDADKARYPQYYDAVIPKLRQGGLCVVDNVLWSGGVLDPQTDDARAIAALNDKVQRDERVENVMLGVRDGI
ncbi:MAG TPA: methyltransferase domain-containing protein, partial [Sorangium sp.]|nr:methyltransferase domain-containing protein [Sorangium sp.]